MAATLGPGALYLNQALSTDLSISAMTRSEIWFDDGNVILQVSDKQYRVHRSLLALHSPVFRDMFSVPQPQHQPSIEGCPIVELADSVDHWDEFLPVLYSKRSAFAVRKNTAKSYAIPVKLMIAMLFLGHKYDFRAFWDQALQFLKSCFPSTLDNFDEVWGVTKSNDDGFSAFVLLQQIFKILHVSLELGIQTVLPAVFYACMGFVSTRNLLQGKDERTGPVYLAFETREKLIVEKESAQKDILNRIFKWSTTRPPCGTQDECERKFALWFGGLVARGKFWDLITKAPSTMVPPGDLCNLCGPNFIIHFKRIRKELFLGLPQRFDLPAWNALRDST